MLEAMYERFMSSGRLVKKKLEKLLSENNHKEAQFLANDSLKDCQVFIEKFEKNSSYYIDIEKSINELNGLLANINQQIAKEYLTC